MAKILRQITGEAFTKHIAPHLSTAKRGFVSRVSLEKIFNAILYKLYTGCQWKVLRVTEENGKRLSYQGIYCLTLGG